MLKVKQRLWQWTCRKWHQYLVWFKSREISLRLGSVTIVCLFFIPKIFVQQYFVRLWFCTGRYCMKTFPAWEFCSCWNLKLRAALLSVHEQTHIYVRQALSHSINICYASELKRFHVRKLLMVDKFSTNNFSYSVRAVRKYFCRKEKASYGIQPKLVIWGLLLRIFPYRIPIFE